ncbi:universal stress protein [Streptomyces sp. AV19]|nr:universal stress protein [Streptomyces sp. AV19]
MAVIVWITEGTWRAAVAAARTHVPDGTDVVLLHVSEADVTEAAHGAFAHLLGRGRPERDPGTRMERAAAASAGELLAAAAGHLGRPCSRAARAGVPEREVVAAAEGADLLVVARDGDRTRLGPRSLAPATRFVVDHAPCPLLLVWPSPPPAASTLPPAPPEPGLIPEELGRADAAEPPSHRGNEEDGNEEDSNQEDNEKDPGR